MFLLEDLPNEATYRKFKKEYPDMDILSTDLFLKSLKLGSDYLCHLDLFLKQFDLSHGRWITLILLNRENDKKAIPSVLAKKQGVTRATISNLLDRLEKDGLVKRVSCDQDGRSVHIELTKQGKSKLDKVMPEYYCMVKKLFGNFKEEGLKQMIKTFTFLQKDFDQKVKKQ